MKKTAISLVLIVVLLACMLASCNTTSNSSTTSSTSTVTTSTSASTTKTTTSTPVSTPKSGGILKFAQTVNPAEFGYSPKAPGFSRIWTIGCYEGLVKPDANGNWVGWLATEWQIDPAGHFVTFTLRPSVKFHDGTDFNAQAVKTNIDLRMQFNPGEVPGLKSVDVLDTYVVRFNLDYYNTILFHFLTEYGMASPTYLAQGAESCSNKPVGTGPFKFVSHTTDVSTIYERFDNYWQKGKPYLQGIQYLTVADQMTMRAALEKDEVNMAMVGNQASSELKAQGYNVVSGSGMQLAIALDTVSEGSIFKDIKIREAIEYAIDRPAIAQAIGYGFTAPLTEIVPQGMPGHIPSLNREYNVEKAKQLLKDAGYADGFETTMYTRGFDEVVSFIKYYLGEVGITVDLQSLDSGSYVDRRMVSGWTNSMLWMENGWLGFKDTIYNIQRFAGAGVADWKSIARPAGWDDLVESAIRETDKAKWETMCKELVQMAYDDAVYVPLLMTDSVTTFQSYVKDSGRYVWHSYLFDPENTWFDK
jgi:peptide/nickel transport system substrate-binding protein